MHGTQKELPPPDWRTRPERSIGQPRPASLFGSDGHDVTRVLRIVHRQVDRLRRPAVLALAAGLLLIVGGMDFLSGYEVSMSVFYLLPVAVAAWYAGPWSGIVMAVLSCLSWYFADIANGHPYSHPVIPVWNALVRLGFFVITGLLLATLKTSLRAQQELARTDALTGLSGRRDFDARLKHDLALGQRRRSALSLAYLDVDDFKAMNDTYGHDGGDRALRAIAAVLKGALRETDTAARLGGDEFALILPDTDGHGARQIVSRLMREFGERPLLRDWGMTCSIGVVTFLDSSTSSERAVAAADQTMYQVKRGGKGAVAFTVLGGAVPPDAPASPPHVASR